MAAKLSSKAVGPLKRSRKEVNLPARRREELLSARLCRRTPCSCRLNRRQRNTLSRCYASRPSRVSLPSIYFGSLTFCKPCRWSANYSPAADLRTLLWRNNRVRLWLKVWRWTDLCWRVLRGVFRALLPLMMTMTTKTRLDRLSPGRKNGLHPKSKYISRHSATSLALTLLLQYVLRFITRTNSM